MISTKVIFLQISNIAYGKGTLLIEHIVSISKQLEWTDLHLII